MIGPDEAVAVGGLLLAVVIGLLAHEWAHAVVLRLADVEYTVSYFPGRTDGLVSLLASCPWAAVHPSPTGREPAWVLRVAALAPLSIAVPVFALVAFDVVSTGSSLETAIAIGLLACAIPSPQDFSVAFYAHRVLEEVDDANARSSRAD
ncbi:hypothetical protein [Natrarchaeobius oligotrophus]|uniref:DUF3267 domain-containing protein n=1 Tax=Natrarchaeobius chitinivorans TaxID=1679083 RepID=A0A3N6PEH9_NATCH|nr:hypothetical protein [Natrarchaeobius chitinivorans]RQG98199.1 hypothetical protein EA472_18535 [Natrarchaeobius chitinivorans]